MEMKWTDFIPGFIKRAIINNAHNINNLPPANFFALIKDKTQDVTPQMLNDLRKFLSVTIQGFIDNGQVQSAARLTFHLKCIDKEMKVIDAGLTKFVLRDDLDDFLLRVSNQVVKIIELENYERKIPDSESKEIQRVKDLFDQVYIVYTDYTGREDRKIEKKKRAYDPIAFGTFKSEDNVIWNHRFYFICDWEDEYCDLTLDNYVSQMISAGYDTPVHEAKSISVHELEERITAAQEKLNDSDIPGFIINRKVMNGDE